MVSPGEISLLCRLCLVKDQVNVPIFGEQGDIRQIFLKISSCLPVTVSKEDQLPKNICEGCSDKLDLLFAFWNSSRDAEKTLVSWLKQASVDNANETINAIAKQISAKPVAEVKQETDDGQNIKIQQSSEEGKNDESEEAPPPPKRARRTAAVKAQISISQEDESEEEEDDVDAVEPLTKVEDESDMSDNDGADNQPLSSFVDMPGTSADDQEQAGPSGVGKDGGADAPFHLMSLEEKNHFIFRHFRRECKVLLQDVLKYPSNKETRQKRTYRKREAFGITLKEENAARKKYGCYICFQKFATSELLSLHKLEHGNEEVVENTKVTEEPKNQEKAKEKTSDFKCTACNVFFENQEDVRNHLHVRYTCKYYCNYCHRSFNTKGAFIVHILQHGSMKISYACEKCSSTFGDCFQLKRHYVSAHGDTKQSLKSARAIQPKAPESAKAPEDHNKQPVDGENESSDPINGPIPIFDCDVCYDVFSSRLALVRHKVLHVQQDPSNKSDIVCLNEVQPDYWTGSGDIEPHIPTETVMKINNDPLPMFTPGTDDFSLGMVMPAPPPPISQIDISSMEKDRFLISNAGIAASQQSGSQPSISKQSPNVSQAAAATETSTTSLSKYRMIKRRKTATAPPPPPPPAAPSAILEGPPPLQIQSGNLCYKIVHPPSNNPAPSLLSGGQSFILNPTTNTVTTQPGQILVQPGNQLLPQSFLPSQPSTQSKRIYFLVPNGEIPGTATAQSHMVFQDLPPIPPKGKSKSNSKSTPKGNQIIQLAHSLSAIKPDAKAILKQSLLASKSYQQPAATSSSSELDKTIAEQSSIVMPIITNITTVVDDEEDKTEKLKKTPMSDYGKEFTKFLQSSSSKEKAQYQKQIVPKPKAVAPEIINVDDRDDSSEEKTFPVVDNVDPLAQSGSVPPPDPNAPRPKIYVKNWAELSAAKPTNEIFKCDFCQQRLNTWTELTGHLALIHEKYACQFSRCYVFSSPGARDIHTKDMHTCRHCHMVFRTLRFHDAPNDCYIFKSGKS